MIPSAKNLTAKKGAEALLVLQKSVYARNGFAEKLKAKKKAASKKAQETARAKKAQEGTK